jgi:hypothetical protein
MGFEPTISVLKLAKIVCALDRAVTAIGEFVMKLISFSARYSISCENIVKRIKEQDVMALFLAVCEFST